MVMAIRSSLVAVIVASGCADPVGTSGEDGTLDNDGSDDVALCATALPCPAPTSGTTQSICGQLYELETNAKLGDGTVAGSLAIEPYDAIAFAQGPGHAAPLAHGDVHVDSCGRFRVSDIDVSGIGPFVALAIDDTTGPGPAGTKVATAVATPKQAGGTTLDLEAWTVAEATTTRWAMSGGPPLSGGVFVPVFRAHQADTPDADPFEPQAGVTVTWLDNPIDQYYFEADTLERTNIDTAAVTTGANGTALITDATVHNGVAYSGIGGLGDPASCRWHSHVGMSLPYIVFVQIFRPVDVPGEQCPL